MLDLIVATKAAIAGVIVLAHPHGTTGRVWLPGALALAAAACLVVGLVAVWDPVTTTHPRRADRPDPAPSSQHRLWWAARVLAAAVFVSAIAAGRVWNSGLTPVLLVVVGLPTFLVLNGLFGQVWAWVDPFDTLARLVTRLAGFGGARRDAPLAGRASPATDGGPSPERDVRLAVFPAVAWMAYLTAFESPLDPRQLALVLTVYTVALLVGCVIAGRRSWIQDVEVLGTTLRWVGRIRRGGLVSWDAPRGAGIVCGVLLGGLLFEGLHTLVLGEHPTTLLGRGLLLGAALASAALGALFVSGVDAWADRRGAGGSATAAAVPMVAAVGLSVALADNRFLIGLQLLPRLLGDPLGRGWSPLEVPVAADPLGSIGLLVLQSLVLLVGALVAIRIARRRSPTRRATLPAVMSVEILLALAVLGVAGR